MTASDRLLLRASATVRATRMILHVACRPNRMWLTNTLRSKILGPKSNFYPETFPRSAENRANAGAWKFLRWTPGVNQFKRL
jgi:hypothetical protein